MQKVIIESTMSLDGFIAGPNITTTEPMGNGGQRLHEWLFNSKTDADEVLLREIADNSGAVITGARTYTTAIDDAWEGQSPFIVPAFVVCHNPPAKKVEGFSYVQGIENALEQAMEAAGEKNVWIMGGANIIQQYLQLKAFDELHIHIVPVLFTEGTRLFDLIGKEKIELNKLKIVDTPAATHIYYEVKRQSSV